MKKIFTILFCIFIGVSNMFGTIPTHIDNPTTFEKELINKNINKHSNIDSYIILDLILDEYKLIFFASDKLVVDNITYIFGVNKQIKAIALQDNTIKLYLKNNKILISDNVRINNETKELINSLPTVNK